MSDLIRREEVIEALKLLTDEGDPYDEGYNLGLNTAILEVKKHIPTAEPKVGRWKPHPTEPEWDICTVCGIGTRRRQITMDFVEEESYQYCPRCGAKMEGSE